MSNETRQAEGWLEVQRVAGGMFSDEVAVTITRPSGATESHFVPRATVDMLANRVLVTYWLTGNDCWVDLPTSNKGNPITVNRAQVSAT